LCFLFDLALPFFFLQIIFFLRDDTTTTISVTSARGHYCSCDDPSKKAQLKAKGGGEETLK
jgi:hypothetical protein